MRRGEGGVEGVGGWNNIMSLGNCLIFLQRAQQGILKQTALAQSLCIAVTEEGYKGTTNQSGFSSLTSLSGSILCVIKTLVEFAEGYEVHFFAE